PSPPRRGVECGMRNAELQREVRVATRPSTDIPHSAFRIPHCQAPALRRPLPILINTPVATRATNRLDRPYEMNGSVIPVAGSRARLTPIYSAAVLPIRALSPPAISWPNA